MKLPFLIAAAIVLSSAKLHAQDTTGGTRPTLIIPLHKKNTNKKSAAPLRGTPAYRVHSLMKTSPPLNADDRKMKRTKKTARKP